MRTTLFQRAFGAFIWCSSFLAALPSMAAYSNSSIHPALIPAPRSINWTKTVFNLAHPIALKLDPAFANFESRFTEIFKVNPMDHSDIKNRPTQLVLVRYKKMKPGYLYEQAYEIHVTDHQIEIAAEFPQGVFYAIQTLRQLISNQQVIPGCDISDRPAFAWRGLMHDVGRNFQSIPSLKQQIDIMAAYKMNIFHLHLTEDIAWRLQVPSYPQLTAASNMKRNQGKFYTIPEIKDLIQYCKDRFITLIPEIDMPGHSDAFKRAMGVDMQSEKGLEICKKIMHEICSQLDVPYIHMGGDEVHISNPRFMPEMAALVQSENKKIVAWNPGAEMPANTVLQMWNGNTIGKKGYPSLDSRHLYVNHHDPIDAVVATFNHMICDVPKGDSENIGAITCVWPDRRVSKEEEIISMNPVYPELVTLAERSWKGGGYKNYQSDIDSPGTERYKAFVEFEHRLLEHKDKYFSTLPFSYVQQSDIHWKLIGPFDNHGKTDSAFYPEKLNHPDEVNLQTSQSLFGGTIFLRHFWAPMIGSHLKNQKENTTYYAFTKFYSNTDREIGFWIGFNNVSRSTNTSAPQSGTWDNRNSCLYINGKKINPPAWQHAGVHHKDLETPLVDENYEIRKPTMVQVKKGWNTMLVKAPVSSFKSNDWQSPVKWMFTVIPVIEHGINYTRPEGLIFDPLGKQAKH